MKILGIVPARSGSKGFRHKNISEISGKSLLELAVITGKDCPLITDLYVSTDSKHYEQIAKRKGALSAGLRPKRLSGDNVKTVDVVIHLLNQLKTAYDYVILLQPSSPVRSCEQIIKMFSILKKHKKANAIVTVEAVSEPHPHKMKKMNQKGFLESLMKGTSSEMPRQKLPPVFKLTGAVYIVKTSALLKERSMLPCSTLGYVTERTINIDHETDLEILKIFLKKRLIKIGH